MSYEAVIIDKNGRRRRARPGEVLGDGETVHFLMTMQDDDGGIRDAYGLPAGHRRGFAISDISHLRDAAARAYEERNERLRNAWRKDHQRQQDGPRVTTRTLDVEQARALADGAYEDKKQRLQNAWRNRV